MEAGDGMVNETISAVWTFDSFSEENDPDGYHDFGAVEFGGKTIFWKIYLYETNSDFRYSAETPDDPAITTSVLTIMLASDWWGKLVSPASRPAVPLKRESGPFVF
ncbi:hypothetical protein Jann_4219 (plasmid) [Jannaschia sp. CCS1]|nr:hypothetical protein Jann_4219 [Jannaschia sp. CCS1]